MLRADLPAFTELLDAVCGMLTRGTYSPNDVATGMFFRAMARYSLDDVRDAFDGHVADPQRGRFAPTPADLIAVIESRTQADGRPGAEEAWTIALECADEGATVVWTEEIAEAWGAARIVFNMGDEVGARMAFRETYTRLVDGARGQGRAPAWNVALGQDKARQADALRRADTQGRPWRQVGELGRTTGAEDVLALPAPGAVPALLLAGRAAEGIPTSARAALAALSARLSKPELKPSPDAVDRERVAQLQRETLERVVAYGLAHEIPLPVLMPREPEKVQA